MIARALTLTAIAASVLVALGFVLFAIDQARASSERQQAVIEGTAAPDPTPRAERARERRNGTVREWVDDANDVLLKPFQPLVSDRSIWAQRGLAALIALLVYGLGLTLLANFARGLPRPLGDRRTGLAQR